MELTLYVPGLLLPEPVLTDTVFDLTTPAFSMLLGRSNRRVLPPDWLSGTFGTHEPLPAAALRKVGAGGTASGHWMCLDPVHWQVGREGITLDDPALLGLNKDEAGDLIDALAPSLAHWGTLSASSPGCWELQLRRPLALTTHPLPSSIGLPIDPGLPAGEAGREWRTLLSEMQTLLHAHPVNRRREQHGRLVINSLWAWGDGCLPADLQVNFNVVWASDPVIGGLCAHAGIPCLSPPDRFQPASGHVLAIANHLVPAATKGDALNWRDALQVLERRWFAPALAALKRGECTRLHIVGASSGHQPRILSCELTRSDLLRFWRRPLPLTALA